MKLFNSRYNVDPTPASPAGKEIKQEYQIKVDENGHKELIEAGQTNVYEKIQSFKDECLLENIINRAINGDPTALKQEGQFIDMTNLPSSFAQAQTMICKVKNEFAELPKEVKEKFNNSTDNYIQTYASKEWAENMGFTKTETETAPKKIEKENKEKENKENE